MITPDKVVKRNVTIPASSTSDEANIAQTDIRFGNKNITLLVGPDFLLRFDFKKNKVNRKLEKLKVKIIKDKKIFTTEKRKTAQDILLIDQGIREALSKDKKDLLKRSDADSEDFLDKLERKQKKLNDITRKIKFDIIELHTEYFCKKCNGFRPGPDLTQSNATCIICQNLLKKEKITLIDNDIGNYLRGYWLEDYIANILNSYGWKAWSSPNLMIHGVSGAPHQIDVLGIKDGKILIVECKTGDFSPTQVMNFLGKYYDIRCHQALAVAVGKIHLDAKKLIQKNSAICYHDEIKSFKKLIGKISKI